MWMLGALTWLVLAWPLPQPGMSQESACASVMMGKPSCKGAGWSGRSPEAAQFVSRLLQVRRGWALGGGGYLLHTHLEVRGGAFKGGGVRNVFGGSLCRDCRR